MSFILLVANLFSLIEPAYKCLITQKKRKNEVKTRLRIKIRKLKRRTINGKINFTTSLFTHNYAGILFEKVYVKK